MQKFEVTEIKLNDRYCVGVGDNTVVRIRIVVCVSLYSIVKVRINKQPTSQKRRLRSRLGSQRQLISNSLSRGPGNGNIEFKFPF